jgi:hypothetical protein
VLPYAVLTFSIVKPERQLTKPEDKPEVKQQVISLTLVVCVFACCHITLHIQKIMDFFLKGKNDQVTRHDVPSSSEENTLSSPRRIGMTHQYMYRDRGIKYYIHRAFRISRRPPELQQLLRC